MYLVSKAFHNLFKNKGRNIILFIALFSVMLSAVVSLSLFSTANRVMTKTKNYYAGNVVLRQGASGGVYASLDADNYKSFMESGYLKGHLFYAESPVMVTSLSRMFDDDYVDNGGKEGSTYVPHVSHIVDLPFIPNGVAIGMLDEKSTEAFSDGQREIITGAFPGGNECMISKDLAELNGVTVGDKITFKIDRDELECTISGIYSDGTEARTSSTKWSPENNARNNIIVNYAFFDGYSPRSTIKMFILNNASDIGPFLNELYGKGLPASYTLQYDVERYNTAVTPVENMTRMAEIFTAMIFAIGFGVIILINLLALRERRYEIGVLRAIGMPKAKVSLLILGELMILALTATVLAMLAGLFLNQPAADILISMSKMNYVFGFTDVISHIEAGMSAPVALEVLGISVGLVLIAGLGFIVNILRFDPIKILSERN